MVRHILSACNPRLASGLRGLLPTVEQLVNIDSLIEKDWRNTKEYCSRVQSTGVDRSLRNMGKKGHTRGRNAEVAIVAAAPDILVVPIGLGGFKGDAVFDTGCTYSSMHKSLWERVKKENEVLDSYICQKFMMANGQESRAIGKINLLVHPIRWIIYTYWMTPSCICHCCWGWIFFAQSMQEVFKKKKNKTIHNLLNQSTCNVQMLLPFTQS